MKDAGADQYTFHIEATKEPLELCRKIKESGMMVGIGIKPNTPVSAVEEYISEADMVLIMTVEPGFGGQKFMTDMMTKVKHLRDNHPGLNIEVDGGVGPNTIEECAQVSQFHLHLLCFKYQIGISRFFAKSSVKSPYDVLFQNVN